MGLKLSKEQAEVLRRAVEERFDHREGFAQALERAARARGYSNPFLYPVNYNSHLQGRPVGRRYARVYIDVLGERVGFLRCLID